MASDKAHRHVTRRSHDPYVLGLAVVVALPFLDRLPLLVFPPRLELASGVRRVCGSFGTKLAGSVLGHGLPCSTPITCTEEGGRRDRHQCKSSIFWHFGRYGASPVGCRKISNAFLLSHNRAVLGAVCGQSFSFIVVADATEESISAVLGVTAEVSVRLAGCARGVADAVVGLTAVFAPRGRAEARQYNVMRVREHPRTAEMDICRAVLNHHNESEYHMERLLGALRCGQIVGGTHTRVLYLFVLLHLGTVSSLPCHFWLVFHLCARTDDHGGAKGRTVGAQAQPGYGP